MSTKLLKTPIKAEDLEDIHVGDIIYLTGTLVTSRDCVHTRLVKQGRQLPVDLKEKAIFHAGPIMQSDKSSPSGYKVVSIGPTTSMRREKFEYELCALLSERAEWVLTRFGHVRNLRHFIVYFRADARSWLQVVLRRFKMSSGTT